MMRGSIVRTSCLVPYSDARRLTEEKVSISEQWSLECRVPIWTTVERTMQRLRYNDYIVLLYQ